MQMRNLVKAMNDDGMEKFSKFCFETQDKTVRPPKVTIHKFDIPVSFIDECGTKENQNVIKAKL